MLNFCFFLKKNPTFSMFCCNVTKYALVFSSISQRPLPPSSLFILSSSTTPGSSFVLAISAPLFSYTQYLPYSTMRAGSPHPRGNKRPFSFLSISGGGTERGREATPIHLIRPLFLPEILNFFVTTPYRTRYNKNV